MTAHTDIAKNDIDAPSLSRGAIKFLGDVGSIVEIKLLFLRRGWIWYFIRPLFFPLGVFYWLRVMVPDDPQVVLRIMSGAIVLGISLSTANMLGQQVIQDRFLGRMKLLITMPMSKAAYGVGVLAFAVLQASPVVALLLVFAIFGGADISLTWVFLPLILPVLISLAGVTFIISSYAPSMETGSIMANLVGIILVLISPVFFTMEQAPLVLQWVGWVSPMRYAADGIMKSLSGETDVWLEFVILAGFALTTMALGLWKMRWRER